MSQPLKPLYEFGPFLLDPAERQLLQEGKVVPLTPKAFETLVALVEDPGHAVTKEELLARLWPNTFVEEGTLVKHISLLRKALGDREEGSRYVETVPKLGYRFVAPVRQVHQKTGAVLMAPRKPVLAPRVLMMAALAMATLIGTWVIQSYAPGKTQPSKAARPVDPQARELYLRGRFFWNQRTLDGYRKALEHFDQAVARDPNYAEAYAGLADAYALLASYRTHPIPRTEAMARARAAAQKALELDETVAEAHASLAFVHLHFDWNWDAAGKHFARAVELNPGYATAHHWYAYYWAAVGNLEKAVEEVLTAQRLDPQSAIIARDVCEMYGFAGRLDEAIAQCRKAMDMAPSLWETHYTLAFVYQKMGRPREALEELKKTGEEVLILAFSGKQREGEHLLAQKLKSGDSAPSASIAATRYGHVGNLDEAFVWLERAFQERDGGLILSRVEPAYDPLRGDPRFEDLIRRVGLPEIKTNK